MKKTLSILLAVSVCLNVFFGFAKYESSKSSVTTTSLMRMYKPLTFSTSNGLLQLQVPQDWNAYTVGDTVAITNLDGIGNPENAVFSVAAADSPVTYGDINWSQLDFYVSTSNLLDAETVNALKKPADGVRVETWSNNNFTIFSRTEVLPAGVQPSKDQPGGTVFYLVPKTGNSWNLFIRQQSLGNESFEQGVKHIVETLAPIDQDFSFLQSVASKGLTYEKAATLPRIVTVTASNWKKEIHNGLPIAFPEKWSIQPNKLSQADFTRLGPVDFSREQLIAAVGKSSIQKTLSATNDGKVDLIPAAKTASTLYYSFGDEIVGFSYGKDVNPESVTIASWFRQTNYLPVVDISLLHAEEFNGHPGMLVAYGVDQLNMCAYVQVEQEIRSYCFGGDVPPQRMKDYVPLLEEVATRSTV